MALANTTDFLVIGGGIVGLSTAWNLVSRFPGASIRLIEKEEQVASHQSGRNSGVLHSGIYYTPGSLKAQTCREGRAAMTAFCDAEGIAYETCGKIIVATQESELAKLDEILRRGQENGVACERLDAQGIQQLEPNSAGIAGLHVPQAGIVDYPAVCRRLAEKLQQLGHPVHLGQAVVSIQQTPEAVEVKTPSETYQAKFLITCAGLYSDRLVKLSGLKPPAQIVPFRGEYYELKPECRQLCRNLIYPVPDPSFPFLGVHFTRMVSGEVECGPNAVFALAREGYSWGSVNLGEMAEAMRYPGFLKLAARHWRMGMGEIHRSLSKAAFVKALQRLIPSIKSDDLIPGRAGVRAQALTRDGAMVDDFLWVTAPRMLHVCNAPSPAATASLEIGRLIAERVQAEMVG